MENQQLLVESSGDYRFVTVGIPDPSSNESLVRVTAAALCSSDYQRISQKKAHRYPLVLGHEFGGVVVGSGGHVVAVYPLVPCFSCPQCDCGEFHLCSHYSYFGSRQNGGLQRFVAVPDWNLVPVPHSFGPRQVALVEPAAVVSSAVRKLTKVGAAGNILILGSGFLSLLAVYLLKMQGYRRITVGSRSATQRKLFEREGVDFLQHSVLPNRITGSSTGMWDAALDFTGSGWGVSFAARALNPGSQVVIVGNPEGEIRIPDTDYQAFLRKELEIRGTWNSRHRMRGKRSDWDVAVGLLDSCTIPDAWIDEVEFGGIIGGLDRVLGEREKGSRKKVLITFS